MVVCHEVKHEKTGQAEKACQSPGGPPVFGQSVKVEAEAEYACSDQEQEYARKCRVQILGGLFGGKYARQAQNLYDDSCNAPDKCPRFILFNHMKFRMVDFVCVGSLAALFEFVKPTRG